MDNKEIEKKLERIQLALETLIIWMRGSANSPLGEKETIKLLELIRGEKLE